jgi:hypothetical protein
MFHYTASGRLRTLVREIRAAHARSSQEWIHRMEAPADRGPRRPL